MSHHRRHHRHPGHPGHHAPHATLKAEHVDWVHHFADIKSGNVAGLRMDNNGAITNAPIPDNVTMRGGHLVDRTTGKAWDEVAAARATDIKTVAAEKPVTDAIPYTQLPGAKTHNTLAHAGQGPRPHAAPKPAGPTV